ncbi:MAG TPA: glycosyltransferase [Acidimicrobiales bacterium]|nr:glycosyltransferase [Acidimicrobiales bacterium]
MSVVIPTFNRAELLRRTLGSLTTQEYGGNETEVIVVDDGSTDHTASVVAEYPDVVYLHQANAGPSAARNRGWSEARGEVVAFTDDDTVPDHRWLADLSAAFSADPDLAAAGGTVRPLRETFLTEFVQLEQHASHGVRRDGQIKYLVTANCAYRRDVLASLGGFDETFPAASGEDTDLTMRAQAHGYRMKLLDGAVVLHDHPSHIRQILKSYLKHGRTRRLVLDKNPLPGGPARRIEVLTRHHWQDRFQLYRQAGLGPAGSLAAIGLRAGGLVAYATGMGLARLGLASTVRGTLQVVVACPGADHVDRGYERVSRELTALLSTDPDLAVTMIKGSGNASNATVLPLLRRDRAGARAISRLLSPAKRRLLAPQRRGKTSVSLLKRVLRRQVLITPYEIEAATFGVSLLGYIFIRRPDVVVLQDVLTARVVRAGRRLAPRLRTRVLFINGAPWPAPYPFADVVQHVTPVTWRPDRAAGWEKVLLPLGTSPTSIVSPTRAQATRRRFGIPEGEKVVISVGAMLDHHKRHLCVVREVARMSEPRPFLVLAGAPETDQKAIETSARELLGAGQLVIHASPEETRDLLSCADMFVLASLREGFGLAYLEALAAGLPVLAHDDELQRWILGRFGAFVDTTEPGELARSIAEVLSRADRWELAESRQRYVNDRFSWNALRDDYLDLIRQTSRAAG